MRKTDLEKLVSIIVPVYNTEKYLEKCVTSLIKQTYKKIEIILVDDGSTDSSFKLCDEYAKNDSRIKVIHKSNGGLTSSRKTGIDNVTGDYVMFVDSDDWLDQKTIEICLKNAINWNADCVMFAYVREYLNGQFESRIFQEDLCFTGRECKDKIHRRLIGPVEKELSTPQRLDIMSTMCMKLYKTQVVKRGKLVNERVVGTSEDTIFNIYALEKCKIIGYVNQTFYHYRKTNEQSLTTMFKKDLSEKWDVLYKMMESYIKENSFSERYEAAFYNRVACGMIGLGLNEISSNNSFYEKKKKIAWIIKKPLYKKSFSLIEIRWCPVQWKLFFLFCKMQSATGVTTLLYVMNYLRAKISN